MRRFALLPAIVLLIPAVAATAGGAESVTIRIDGVEAGVLAQVVAARADLEVFVAPAVAGRRISVRFEDTPVLEALRIVALLVGEPFRYEHGRYAIGDYPDSRNAAIRSRLRKRVLALKPEGEPLPRFFDRAAQGLGATVIADPRSLPPDRTTPKLSAGSSSLRADDALDLATATAGLDWDVRWGVVLVATPVALRSLPRTVVSPPRDTREAYLRSRLRLERLDLAFPEESLVTVVDFIAEARDLTIRWTAAARTRAVKTTVDHRREGSVETHLLHLLVLRDFELRIEGDSLEIGGR